MECELSLLGQSLGPHWPSFHCPIWSPRIYQRYWRYRSREIKGRKGQKTRIWYMLVLLKSTSRVPLCTHTFSLLRNSSMPSFHVPFYPSSAIPQSCHWLTVSVKGIALVCHCRFKVTAVSMCPRLPYGHLCSPNCCHKGQHILTLDWWSGFLSGIKLWQ